jgi:hypothetical protein
VPPHAKCPCPYCLPTVSHSGASRYPPGSHALLLSAALLKCTATAAHRILWLARAANSPSVLCTISHGRRILRSFSFWRRLNGVDPSNALLLLELRSLRYRCSNAYYETCGCNKPNSGSECRVKSGLPVTLWAKKRASLMDLPSLLDTEHRAPYTKPLASLGPVLHAATCIPTRLPRKPYCLTTI